MLSTSSALPPPGAATTARNARLRAIFDVSPFGIAASDPNGMIVDTNPAYQRMLGYSDDELRRMHFSALSDPSAFTENERVFAEMVAGRRDSYVLEKTYRRKDGQIIWARVTAQAVRDENGNLAYSVALVEDITERRRMARALVAEEQRHRSLLETLPLIVYRCDPTPPFATRYISPAVRMLGYSLEEWLRSDSSWVDAIHPEDRAAVIAESESARRDRRKFACEYRMLARDGSVRWYHDIGDFLYDDLGPTSWQGIMLDVTERKQAELALKQSEELFRALTEQTGELISILSSTGTFTYASPSFERILGWTSSELIGRPLASLVHPDDLASVRHVFAGVSGAAGASRPVTVRVRHKRGEWRVIEGSGTNLLHHPVVRGIISNARDVTDRRELEEQLRHAQKMDAVGKLAGGIAHDFNNLLTVIIGRAEFMQHSAPTHLDWHRDIHEIRDAAGRAAVLTRQLLAYSRKQMLQPKVLAMNDVVAGLTAMLERLIGEDIELVTRPGRDVAAVHADPGQLEQVLVNLIVNARDAMPLGGAVVIATRNQTIAPESELSLTNDGVSGAFVVLSVTDTGVGMDDATLPRIFEPFFTTKGVGHGTGLGLSTVYGIAKQSGGFVTVRSRPGMGSSFELFLPAAGADETLDADAAPNPKHRGTETILLVEDEDAVRQLAKRMLRGLGYTVLTARNGREALELASTDPSRIDLVLTDVVMPTMSGRQLAEAITTRRPGVKVVYMSGYTDDVIIRKGLDDPGVSFIEKPFTMTSLAARIRQRLDE